MQQHNDQEIEQSIQAKGKTAPRVTPAQIDALMGTLVTHSHVFPGTTTTVAIAVMQNGFTLGYGMSACASPENFDAEIGQQIAVGNALKQSREKLWELEGYALKQRLTQGIPAAAPVTGGLPPHQQRVIDELADLSDKIGKLEKFRVTPTFDALDPAEKNRLTVQLEPMRRYAAILRERIEAF